MIASILMATALAASQTPAWTWTLYDGAGPIVLANERPDTPDLRSTLECAPHSGLAKLSLYDSAASAGLAHLSSGNATAAVEATSAEDGSVRAPLRTDHPVFARFAVTGNLTFTSGGTQVSVEIPAADLAKLRRFVDLCNQ